MWNVATVNRQQRVPKIVSKPLEQGRLLMPRQQIITLVQFGVDVYLCFDFKISAPKLSGN